jgi:hypothetical protein
MPLSVRWNRPPIALDIPAWMFGFWRKIAARRVDPDLGSPEMK